MNSAPPRATLENWRQHPWNVWGFTHVDSLVPVAPIPTAGPQPLPRGNTMDLSKVSFTWEDKRRSVAETLGETFTDGFMVLKDGAVAAETYFNQQPGTRHIVFSVSKSITATLAGVLVEKGQLDPHAPVTAYVPVPSNSAYADATVRNVLDMTVSIRFVEDYLDPRGDVARYRVAMGWNPPGELGAQGGIQSFIGSLPKGELPHGHRFHYVSPNSDMLGLIIESAAGETIASLLSRHIWQPMHMESDAFITVDALGAPRTAGGICTSLSDLARFGEMVRNGGSYGGRRIIPQSWIDDIIRNGDPVTWSRGEMAALFPQGRYRSKWYVPEPDGNVLCAIGIHGQWIYIDRRSGMVAVKQSSQPIPADDPMDRLTLAMFRALAEELGR